MERWRNEIDRQPGRRCRDYPSFSSTLLDAIYRSIDETDSRGAQDRVSARKESTPAFPESRRIIPPVTKPAVTRARRTTTSSSSDGSSYGASSGAFSSSATESATTPPPPPLRPIRTNPIRSDHFRPDHCISSRFDEKRGKKERNGSIRSCLRDLKNARSPSSPGARLANFLTSIFAAKSKVSAELACSTEQSYSRSCLSKTPSTAKRTVRFCPVSVIVGEDCRPCGEKWVYGGEGLRPAAPPPPPGGGVEMEGQGDG
ncbi:protein BIG GRAIN 1-like, partial [Phalaenopsis equestris]|uniref:protein BIG GRAIN 1-like n=1 Tax=Phalaenopsis equestris TaxID=78828 RepID=UPI0009E32C97